MCNGSKWKIQISTFFIRDLSEANGICYWHKIEAPSQICQNNSDYGKISPHINVNYYENVPQNGIHNKKGFKVTMISFGEKYRL